MPTQTLPHSERIGGYKVTFERTHSGRIVAHWGGGSVVDASVLGARNQARRQIAADNRREKAADAAKAATAPDLRSRCKLGTCSGAVLTAAHRKSARHRNAEAWARHQRTTRY